jgi:monoterpene epsilon-lactone hydrolase
MATSFLQPRSFPPPSTISPQARAVLEAPTAPHMIYPAADDTAGWRELIRRQNEAIIPALLAQIDAEGFQEESLSLGGITTYAVTPKGVGRHDRRVYLDIHGGGLIFLGGDACRAMARVMAAKVGVARVVSPDFRMAPDHPFPASLDDCVSVYRALLEAHAPNEIIVGGWSGGGNLAAALMLRAREEGLAFPAALVLLTPELDLTESGDTFQTLLGLDRADLRLAEVNAIYAAGAPLTDPHLSPLFGDFSLGFPPTFLQSGTRDMFLSNTIRMHRRLRNADIPADLHVFEAMPHGGFGNTPEDQELNQELRKFLIVYWSNSKPQPSQD